MSSHKPKGYAFGGLIKRAAKSAVGEVKDRVADATNALRARPPVARPPRGVTPQLNSMARRQEAALQLQAQHSGWSYPDRRAKTWDKTRMWLDREAGGREVLKHEISDAPSITRAGALQTLREQKMSGPEFLDLATWMKASPHEYDPRELAMVDRVLGGRNLKSIPLNANATLDETLHHPLLKAAYPDVWDRTRMSLYSPDSASGMEGNLGEFHAPRGASYPLAEIRLFEPGPTRDRLVGKHWAGQLDSTVTHEMGHNLQNAFGWQGGASPSIFEYDPVSGAKQSEATQMDHYYRTKGEADARLAQLREFLAREFGPGQLDIPPWDMYSEPSVGVDEKELIRDTSPWLQYFNKRYQGQP